MYLLKAPHAFLATGDATHPPRCEGKVVSQGEVGIVIGKLGNRFG